MHRWLYKEILTAVPVLVLLYYMFPEIIEPAFGVQHASYVTPNGVAFVFIVDGSGFDTASNEVRRLQII